VNQAGFAASEVRGWFREEVTHMLEWLAAAVDFIASIFLAETVSWG